MLTQENVFPKMPFGQIALFFKEFPWLEMYLYKTCVTHAYVSRVERGLMVYRPRVEPVSPYPTKVKPDVDFWRTERLLFLDASGELVTHQVVEKQRRFFWSSKKAGEIKGLVSVGQTVGDALKNLGEDVNRVRFILSHLLKTNVVIVYKTPKVTDFRGWLYSNDSCEELES